MSYKKIGFLGLGLIGGSIARAIRKKHPEIQMIAYTPHESTVQAAMADQVIDLQAFAIDDSFADCDLVFLCAPVSDNTKNLEKLLPYISESMIITDIGSVKRPIHDAVKEHALYKNFIGGHPMTGSERVGYANSKAILMENAYYVVTPEKEVPQETIDTFAEFVRTFGSIPLVINPDIHDFAVAGISHLPHVVAAALVNVVKSSDEELGLMKILAAGGFKDITRIASSSPTLWQGIVENNKENVLTLLDRYIKDLEAIRGTINADDTEGIVGFFDTANTYRSSFANASAGPILKQYVLYMEIEDKPGELLRVIEILYNETINIKNLEITHNRETQDGVLKIEFDRENDLEKSRQILKDNGYFTES